MGGDRGRQAGDQLRELRQVVIDAAEHVVASAPAIPGKKAQARTTFAREPVPVTVLTRDLADLARRAAEHHAAGDSILVLYRRNSDRQVLAEHIQGLLQLEQALPVDQRRLRQLTFHSAKGLQADAVFQVGGISTRRVTPRNSPTVINAALNVRNFWDGRANNIFNGTSPFGMRDPDAAIFVTSVAGGPAAQVRLALQDASAASQAVGPPGSPIEMSCGGRTWPRSRRPAPQSTATSSVATVSRSIRRVIG